MATSMVVATVVTTDMNEATLRERALAQIRRNDSDLRAQLAHEDDSANVVTAILDPWEFVEYAKEWTNRQEKSVAANGTGQMAGTAVLTSDMSEMEFMEHTLQQLRTGAAKPLVALTDEDLEAMEEEQIGKDFARYPFRY